MYSMQAYNFFTHMQLQRGIVFATGYFNRFGDSLQNVKPKIYTHTPYIPEDLKTQGDINLCQTLYKTMN